MPGRGQRLKGQSTERNGVSVGQSAVVEAAGTHLGCQDGGAFHFRQLAYARDEVRMQVSRPRRKSAGPAAALRRGPGEDRVPDQSQGPGPRPSPADKSNFPVPRR